MISVLFEFYFCLCDNGVIVFCIVDDVCNGWLDMMQIVMVNLCSGDYKVMGDKVLFEMDQEVIEVWIVDCQESLLWWCFDCVM